MNSIELRASRFLTPRAVLLALAVLAVANTALAGTWTPVLRNAPGGINLMLLLSDGTVMAAKNDGGTIGSAWFRLTPDIHGSYVNGTWTTLASMHDTRLYYSSQVLKDGRVFVAGGEYGTGGPKAEVYDPLTNVWTQVNPPTSLLNPGAPSPVTGGSQAFSDSDSEILPDGSVLISPVAPAVSGQPLIYNPSTNTWSAGPHYVRGVYQDEASWVKLPDNTILTIDPFGSNSERYNPATNTWINDGIVPVSLYDPFGSELGAALLLPNGKAFYLGSTGHTALYTPSGSTSPGTWVAGPDIPGSHGTPDAPAAMMVNGKILCAVSPVPTSGNHFPSPTTFYEYDSVANSFSSVGAPTGSSDNTSSFATLMLDLPDGNVLYSHFTSQLYVYHPDGSPLASGKPVVNTVTWTSGNSYHLTGTGLNGISEGAAYGDDQQMNSNYPLVRLTAGSNVYYVRTHDWTSTGVQTGSLVVSTEFTVPQSLMGASYSLAVVANGIASDPVSFLAIADCNNNGIVDSDDIANGTSLDCNSDGVPDECQVPPICPTCADCNNDHIPDNCQVPPICPACLDCDSNGVPDACQPDCNSNGRADVCDISLATSLDCQPDGVPDECEVPPICPACPDCDHNGVPDSCQIPSGTLLDCNSDGIPDRCQTDPLLCGPGPGGPACLADCDQNFIPDVCQMAGSFSQQSPDLAPLYYPLTQSFTLTNPPMATGTVKLTFKTVANVATIFKYVVVDVNGTFVTNAFRFDGFACPLMNQDVRTVSAAVWNAAVAGGDATINMVPNNLVSNNCGPNTYISVKVEYPITIGDCNGNAILDVCEIAAGTVFDCNRNNVPDSCEIAAGLLTDSDFNGRADECECVFTCRGDFNFDSFVNGDDTQYFVNCLLANNLLDCGCADMDGDFSLTTADVALFVARLVNDPNLNCH